MNNYDIFLVTFLSVERYESEAHAVAALQAKPSGAVVRRWWTGEHYIIVLKNMSEDTVDSVMKRKGM